MRTIIYKYSPLETGETQLALEDILEASSPYWQVINAIPKNGPFPPTPPSAAAAASAFDGATVGKKLVYTPCSYVAANYFSIKPEEWLRIKFVGPSSRVPRPDVIYEPVVAWPLPELKIHRYQLTLLVQNGDPFAHIAVIPKSRLHHLLQMSKIDSVFTLIPTDNDDDDDDDDNNNNNNDDDDDKKEEKNTSPPPSEEAAADAAAADAAAAAAAPPRLNLDPEPIHVD